MSDEGFEFRRDRLNRLMEDRGWASAEVEAATGVPYATVYKIIRGDRTRVSGEVLAPLAVGLETTIDYLMGVTNDPRPYSRLSMTAAMSELISLVDRLADNRQRDMVLIARAFQLAEPVGLVPQSAAGDASHFANLDWIKENLGEDKLRVVQEQLLRALESPGGREELLERIQTAISYMDTIERERSASKSSA